MERCKSKNNQLENLSEIEKNRPMPDDSSAKKMKFSRY